MFAPNRHGQVRRALTGMGHPVSADAVKAELVKLGFSRQHNRKTDEGSRHPDRNAQFAYINAKAETAQALHLCPRATRSVALAH